MKMTTGSLPGDWRLETGDWMAKLAQLAQLAKLTNLFTEENRWGELASLVGMELKTHSRLQSSVKCFEGGQDSRLN
ncbi:unnamed protein product [Ambrosiozyma monospora]|uniref:Unnamed protein product n=1 Tax=Ambrosiozyma monospora TaxID=43982 RepID=A0A9W6Z332_AMBMO|nr:unnamed protein product [Ambrosiozyma monospora]